MAYFCTFIVGLVFLVTWIVKALNSQQFIWHVFRYQLLPLETVPLVAISFIGLECAVGVMLSLHEFSQWIVPGSIFLLVGLSALTLWSTSTGRTSDCGCYGGLLIFTPVQSILLNTGFIFLLGIAWLNPVRDPHLATWQWVLALTVWASTSLVGWQSRYQPIVNFNRLIPGRRWRRHWLKDSPFNLQQGTYFVVFLTKGCPYCKLWIPVLNAIANQNDSPPIMGVMDLTREELEAFRNDFQVRFPLISMDKLLFGYLVDAFPTAVSLQDGVILNKWIGQIPEEFLERIEQIVAHSS